MPEVSRNRQTRYDDLIGGDCYRMDVLFDGSVHDVQTGSVEAEINNFGAGRLEE